MARKLPFLFFTLAATFYGVARSSVLPRAAVALAASEESRAQGVTAQVLVSGGDRYRVETTRPAGEVRTTCIVLSDSAPSELSGHSRIPFPVKAYRNRTVRSDLVRDGHQTVFFHHEDGPSTGHITALSLLIDRLSETGLEPRPDIIVVGLGTGAEPALALAKHDDRVVRTAVCAEWLAGRPLGDGSADARCLLLAGARDVDLEVALSLGRAAAPPCEDAAADTSAEEFWSAWERMRDFVSGRTTTATSASAAPAPGQYELDTRELMRSAWALNARSRARARADVEQNLTRGVELEAAVEDRIRAEHRALAEAAPHAELVLTVGEDGLYRLAGQLPGEDDPVAREGAWTAGSDGRLLDADTSHELAVWDGERILIHRASGTYRLVPRH